MISNKRIGLGYLFGVLAIFGCGQRSQPKVDLDFDIPRTEAFLATLSEYGLFAGDIAELLPAENVVEYELASPLFTDYSRKQRLLKIPPGEPATYSSSGALEFPEGTVVAKTFYYLNDFRDESQGRRIIETRLLILRNGAWNVATYVWNSEQTDATLLLEGDVTAIEWADEEGTMVSTNYEIPGEFACVTCHQSQEQVVVLGLTARNLNYALDSAGISQLQFLRDAGQLIFEGDTSEVSTIPSYDEAGLSTDLRARAYLDANCAHCHNPTGWDEARSDEEFDFRFETPYLETGIGDHVEDVERVLIRRRMPLIGTTLIDESGVELVTDFLGEIRNE